MSKRKERGLGATKCTKVKIMVLQNNEKNKRSQAGTEVSDDDDKITQRDLLGIDRFPPLQ